MVIFSLVNGFEWDEGNINKIGKNTESVMWSARRFF